MAEVNGYLNTGRIEALNGQNYHIWAMKIAAVLRSRKLYKSVIEENEPPLVEDMESSGAKKRLRWEEMNNEAFGIIILTLKEEQAGQFINETNAKKVWNELKQMYAGNIEDRKIDAGIEIKEIKMAEKETIESYIIRGKNISTKNAALGQKITERELVYYLVRGLNAKYESVASVLRPQRSATLEEVTQALKEEEARLDSKNNGSHFEKAYKAFVRKPNRSRECFICKRTNHIAKDCRFRKDRQPEQSNWNGYQGRGMQRKQFQTRGRGEQAKMAEVGDVENAFVTVIEIDDNYKNDVWLLDSACTSHMTNNDYGMHNTEYVEIEINSAGNSQMLKSKLKGDIIITANNEKDIDIKIKDVLYVPNLRNNLMSVPVMIEKGNEVHFNKKGAKVINSEGKVIVEATRERKLYILKTKRVAPRNINNEKCFNNSTVNNNISISKNLWHNRLGHINEGYLDILKNNELVHGLNYKNGKIPKCKTCILGKMVDKTHKRIKDKVSNAALQLVHVDLCGPMSEPTLGGSKYIFIIVDDYTRMIFIKLLKKKTETLNKFKEWKNWCENELGTKLKKIRSDNGTEFTNSAFQEFLREQGIHHEKTVPNNPESNGVAERGNRTILDKARVMLIKAELPTRFWGEAVVTAAKIQNCITGKENKTPIEKWTGMKPNVSYMKVFGCTAFCYIHSNNRGKFDARAKRGVFVGYSLNRKAYRIYDPINKKIEESRNVKFYEDEIGYQHFKESQEISNKIELEYVSEEPVLIYISKPKENRIPEDTAPIELENELPAIVDATTTMKEQTSKGKQRGITHAEIQQKHILERKEAEKKLIEDGARRSDRLQKKPEEASISYHETKIVPKSFNEAIDTQEKEEWLKSMNEEMMSMDHHGVWELVNRPTDKRVLKSKWVYAVKENDDGTVARWKSRLVAAGYGQQVGVDYEASFAPVMSLTSWRTLMAIGTKQNLKMKRYDIKTAFLNGDLEEEVYLEQPEGFVVKGKEDKVCKVLKSLYGLPQSGRMWYKKLNQILTENELIRLKSDPCIYTYSKDNQILWLGVFTDDMHVFGSSNDFIDKVMNKIQESIEVKEIRESKTFLGVTIDETEEGITLSQCNYIDKILIKYGLENCNDVKTPGLVGQKLESKEDDINANGELYREMLGSLMYVANATRPDISLSISQLSQFSREPKQSHMIALKRVYRYIKGTKDKKLKFNVKNGPMVGYSDASWCTTSDSRSYMGYLIDIGDSLVSWKAVKQPMIALSTCESEIMSVHECAKEIQFLTQLIAELNMKQYIKTPLNIYCDSSSAINWIKNETQTARTKHVNRKFNYVKEEVCKGNVKVNHLSTEEMRADAMTKVLSSEKLLKCFEEYLE